MGNFTLFIILLFFTIGIVYLGLKGSCIKKLNKAKKDKNAKELIALASSAFTRKFISAYTCDLYIARAYSQEANIDVLKQHLRKMFSNTYNAEDTTEYLTLYYHIFVRREDWGFAKEVLQVIYHTADEKFILSCEWTKEVLLDGKNDICDAMQTSIEAKEYGGFLLGVIAYLIAIQKKRLNLNSEALDWYTSAQACFQPYDLYTKDVNAELEGLKQKVKFGKYAD